MTNRETDHIHSGNSTKIAKSTGGKPRLLLDNLRVIVNVEARRSGRPSQVGRYKNFQTLLRREVSSKRLAGCQSTCSLTHIAKKKCARVEVGLARALCGLEKRRKSDRRP